MNDLIHKQDAMNEISRFAGYLDNDMILRLRVAINRLPSVQQEIIRCKDCKHLFEDNKCPLRTWWTHTENDFCSFAERKDNG